MKSFSLGAISMCLSFALLSAQVTADPTEPPGGDGWFCDQGKQNKEWVCVQSDTVKAPEPPPGTLELEKRDVRPLKELFNTESTEPILEPATAPDPIVDSVTETEPAIPMDTNLPLYVQLSYKPGQAINISKLPPEFYVVQLMSLTNKNNLESYFGKHKLIGLSAARVESNGAILYVLLLGIYENFAKAKQASENMPTPLDKIEPWIRSLASLQKAMVRADDLSGSSDY